MAEQARVKDFDRCFSGIEVRIEEWRGGYTRFEAHYPLCPLEKPMSFNHYDGGHNADLWRLEIPPHEREGLTGTLWLETDGRVVALYATGGRFGSASPVELKPRPENVFLAVPLNEGPAAEQ